jgi:hypothetical protein
MNPNLRFAFDYWHPNCDDTMMTLVISTKINLKVGDDPVVKEVQEWCK